MIAKLTNQVIRNMTKKSGQRFFITRCDYNNHHGWLVRIRFHTKQISQRTFSDSIYGGFYEALEEAKCWRDEQIHNLLESLPDPIGAAKSFHRPIIKDSGRNQTSGVSGVSRVILTNTVKGKTYEYPVYLSSIRPRFKGKEKQKAFRVSALGEDGAKQAAIKHRKEMTALVYGDY